jgi:hypothetical protein
MNDMMAATFALVFLDSGFRVTRWLRAQNIDWSRLMVIFSGRAGRPTAGLTWQSNSQCYVLHKASGEQAAARARLYRAARAGLVPATLDNAGRARSGRSRVPQDLVQHPRDGRDGPGDVRRLSGLPPDDRHRARRRRRHAPWASCRRVKSPEDRRAFITLLRFVMEDPRQQLANAPPRITSPISFDDPSHPRVLEAARHSVDMALRAGKVAAMNATTLQEAAKYAAWGVSCFVIGTDQSLLRSAAQEAADAGGERLRAALVVPA